jgi:hypothetical protein
MSRMDVTEARMESLNFTILTTEDLYRAEELSMGLMSRSLIHLVNGERSAGDNRAIEAHIRVRTVRRATAALPTHGRGV